MLANPAAIGPAFDEGAYRTPPRRVSPWAAMFPSLSFYPRLIASVFRASAKARRGEYRDEDWCRTSLGMMRALEDVGVRFEITGMEHLEALDAPCVFVGNHMSTLETAILPTIIQPVRPVTFVVKQSLVDYPVFRHVMRSRQPIALGQTDPRSDLKTTLAEGVDRLERGVSVVVFPQGRRTQLFSPAEFNSIGVKLAQRASAPIVPLALATDAWALGRGWLADFGRIRPKRLVRFAFGPPLELQGRGGDEHRAVIQFIGDKLAGWEAARGDAPRLLAPGPDSNAE
jgi:1-acyl-sn-glycerol-3-phosphate acyltransferase